MAMNDFDSPDARLIEFQNTIFGQDQPVLESQRPKRLPLAPAAEAHCAADRMSTAYRRHLRQRHHASASSHEPHPPPPAAPNTCRPCWRPCPRPNCTSTSKARWSPR
jgi:hypothetical protein